MALIRELLSRLYNIISRTTHLDPHPGLIIATHHLSDPFPIAEEIELLSVSVMDLLAQYAFPSLSGYGKFTISLTIMQSSEEEITFTAGEAIPLTYEDNTIIPMSEIYTNIFRNLQHYLKIYDGYYVVRLTIRVYVEGGKKMDRVPLSEEERDSTLYSIIESIQSQSRLSEIEPITARDIINRKRRYPSTHITALKGRRTKVKPFIVADIETLLINNYHYPYAVGYMLVRPGDDLNPIHIDTYFSEDYSIILDSFEERSTKKYTVKPLIRNNRLYEIAVYSGSKMIFRIRDSLNLLPGSLKNLAKNLCPGLGTKGSIPYKDVTPSNVLSMKKMLLDYMKQDILLLGGVMQKAQEICWKLFKIDIECKITQSSLALSIFRMKFYDASNWPIHIPNKNEDSFIRRGYYGGHTDVYKPYGENLYYYDVNSLYPFVMKEYPMPGGKPVWHANFEGMDLDSLFGFIEAYVVCPETIKKPFLPYRDKNNTLIFPTGEFVGVYYSEELKFARSLGYTVIPISGYLFEKKESPFREFVSSLYENRLVAKQSGNEALAYVYKILMNSLYGRFGINPKSTITEICDEDRYKSMFKKLIFAEQLSENIYLIIYHTNTGKDTDYWEPPTNSAVQLAVAITASARMYMYPYTSREDCYYTDTDSVVLGQPLPKDVISSSVLGKFKLEDKIKMGYFIAPKSYYYQSEEGIDISKFKGPAKKLVTPEWFVSQYADPKLTKQVRMEFNFQIDWKKLMIYKKDSMVTLGIKVETKRKNVYEENLWVDTDPHHIIDLSCLDKRGIRIIKLLKNNVNQLQTENHHLKEKLSLIERDMTERYNMIKSKYKVMNNTEEQVMIPLTKEHKLYDKIQPSLNKGKKPKGKKQKCKKQKHKKR
ncbi:hypothetical protein K2173_010161 (mitochondrion) [Erythroxylum novogranatense]|uniref:DNA polymerase n=1 Tax=Erythroxylum novogranatense TaxID=1862640 RepID=A0AAV8S3Y4_9ROSI|nr:hypothetical protein K2173_010161 [Erythroxylum novogranatense]